RRGWFDGEQAAVATTVADAASRERGQEARRAMVMRIRLTDRAEAAGDSPAGARVVDDSARPPGCEHSVSPRPITARQLQALVRQRFCEMPIPLTRESPCVTRNAGTVVGPHDLLAIGGNLALEIQVATQENGILNAGVQKISFRTGIG